MNEGSLGEKVSEAMFECFRAAPVPLKELHAFAQGLALSYLGLISNRNPNAFSASQLQPMSNMIQRGVKVEWLIAAFDQAAALASELLKDQKITVSFATIIAKMTAAQVNLQSLGLYSPRS